MFPTGSFAVIFLGYYDGRDTGLLVLFGRARNGFTVRLAAAADNVVARWRVSRLNA